MRVLPYYQDRLFISGSIDYAGKDLEEVIRVCIGYHKTIRANTKGYLCLDMPVG